MNNLIIESINYRNFLSIGNIPITIDFKKKATTLIYGENGVGKSSFYEALYFCLYGKAFRDANKPDLINNVNNKNTLVQVNIISNGVPYKIIRGIKPNIFEIYRKDILLDQGANVKDYQTMLESNILKMSSNTFTQIVILGSSLYVPFMRLSAKRKRDIQEELLDIQIFSKMNICTKTKITDINNEIRDLNSDIMLLENSIDHIETYVNTVSDNKKQKVKDNKHKIKEFLKEKDGQISFKTKSESMLLELIDKLPNLDTITKTKVALNNHKVNFTNTMKKNNKKIQFFFENENCPTCKQIITQKSKDSNMNELEKKNKEFSSAMVMLEESLLKVEGQIKRYNSISEDIRDCKIAIIDCETKIYNANFSIKLLKDQNIELDKQFSVEDQKIELVNFKKQLEELNTLLSEKEKNKSEYDVILEMLKDDGIKKNIIKSYLPVLNKIISKYLQILGFPIKFIFDDEFNAIIIYKGKNMVYGSLSEGQRGRIDLALLFAFRELTEIKSGIGTNLLIFDEIGDSNLDLSGWEAFQSILNATIGDNNIFIISQRGDLLLDKFNQNVKFVMERGFSKIKYDI